MSPESQSRSQNQSQNSNQPRTQSLLLALPSELKRLICAQFWRHCCRLSPLDIVTFTAGTDVSPLKALSEMCTVFRDIAQPLLYHVPFVRGSYTSFLRAIRERPDLADSVKCLPELKSVFHEMAGDLVADRFTLVKEIAAELQMLTPEDEPFEDEFSYMLAYLYSGKYEFALHTFTGTFQMTEFYTLLYAMLIASLPYLEIINIDHWQVFEKYPPEIYHHAHRRLNRVGRLISDRCTGTTMPTLHTIVVNRWRDFADHWEGRDSDGSGYVYDYSKVHLDPREIFFSCATSLQELILGSCDAPYDWPAESKATGLSLWSTLPNLNSISFKSMTWGERYDGENEMPVRLTAEEVDMAYQRLQEMATQCTALTSFKMGVGYADYPSTGDTFSPSRLLQSLMPTASRLETLTLSVKMLFFERFGPYPSLLVGADLDHFTQLQELSLDEWFFCHHWNYENDNSNDHDHDDNSNDEEGHNDEDDMHDLHLLDNEEHTIQRECPPGCRTNSCLLDVLSTSVTSLNVHLRQKTRAVPDLMHLAMAAVAGSFPKLKHVTVESYFYLYQKSPYGSVVAQPEMLALGPKLAEAFRGSGVTVEVTGIPLN